MIEPEQELSDYQQLASEVKQLTAERDYLLAQARKESESLERKETIKAQFEEQLQELANKISQVILVLFQVRDIILNPITLHYATHVHLCALNNFSLVQIFSFVLGCGN